MPVKCQIVVSQSRSAAAVVWCVTPCPIVQRWTRDRHLPSQRRGCVIRMILDQSEVSRMTCAIVNNAMAAGKAAIAGGGPRPC